MIYQAFNVETDVEGIEKLFSKWGLNSFDPQVLSTVGIVAKDEEDGTIKGVGFLYTTNSALTHLDCFCVDSDLDRELRNEVIDSILDTLVALAKEWGYKFVVAEPRFNKSEKRLLERGFEILGDSGFILKV